MYTNRLIAIAFFGGHLMQQNQIGSYQKTLKQNLQTMTPREVEAAAFTKAAVMLEEAKGQTDNIQAYSQALRFNHLLWTIMQADVTEDENKLPPELKANILSLSIFVDKQTTKALRSSDAKDLDILITINRNLAAGLRETPETAAAAGPAPTAAIG